MQNKMNNQLTFEQKLHKDRDKILTFYFKFQKIYLYGAGFISQMFLRYFQKENLKVEA